MSNAVDGSQGWEAREMRMTTTRSEWRSDGLQRCCWAAHGLRASTAKNSRAVDQSVQQPLSNRPLSLHPSRIGSAAQQAWPLSLLQACWAQQQSCNRAAKKGGSITALSCGWSDAKNRVECESRREAGVDAKSSTDAAPACSSAPHLHPSLHTSASFHPHPLSRRQR